MKSPGTLIVMVGTFPPPVHGMAAVNAAVCERLLAARAEVVVIDIAAPNLDRSFIYRLARFPKVLRGMIRLSCMRGLRKGVLYMSVSGGYGQIYELGFLIVARLRGMRVFMHHHSFAYLDSPTRVTSLLVRLAGRKSIHIVQSAGMAERLRLTYRIPSAVSVSNAVFLVTPGTSNQINQHQNFVNVGFISNISAEKGIFEFLDLMTAVRDKGIKLHARIAGSFQDAATERQVGKVLLELATVEYVGPQYGEQKDDFYVSIDALVFPTRYINEAEPLIIHEAISHGIPVIAYGRGCIPEIVSPECGLVVPPGEAFVPAALAQIEAWLAKPQAFQAASAAAAARFTALREENLHRWEDIQAELLGERLHEARSN